MSDTFSIPGHASETILLRSRVVAAYHDGVTLFVVCEHGHRTSVRRDTVEGAKALLNEIRAWLDGGA